MPSKSQPRLARLSIWLYKKGIRVEKGAVDESQDDLTSTKISRGQRRIGVLFHRQAPTKPPSWQKFFASVDQFDSLNFRSTSASALLVVEAADRLFAVSFGYARTFIEQTSIERNFGLRTVLNAVESNRIRSIDRTSLDNAAFNSREQASAATEISDFGIDVETDLLRAVVGSPDANHKFLGSNVAGADYLSCSVNVEIIELRAFLAKVLEVFKKEDFRKRYPWIDNVRPVRDEDLKRELDNLLVARLNSKQEDEAWLALPEIVDFSDFGGIVISGTERSVSGSDLTMDRLRLANGNRPLTIDNLRKQKARMLRSSDEQETTSWNIYSCVNAEISHDGSIYVLTNGEWFQVEKKFSSTIETFYSTRGDGGIILPRWPKAEHEGRYNEILVASNPAKYCLMDKKLVHVTGESGGVEVCDALAVDGAFIHVKRYSQSSALSHLFAQGAVSGELFATNKEYREKACSHVPLSHKGLLTKKKPNTSKYRIVFAIGQERLGNLKLPFFSKVSFKHASHRLENALGFAVSLVKINIV